MVVVGCDDIIISLHTWDLNLITLLLLSIFLFSWIYQFWLYYQHCTFHVASFRPANSLTTDQSKLHRWNSVNGLNVQILLLQNYFADLTSVGRVIHRGCQSTSDKHLLLFLLLWLLFLLPLFCVFESCGSPGSC